MIRGKVSFENANLEDFVVWRSNGTPTFLLANAVDDTDMGITHVIRGEDLVSATPKILMIRDALGGGERPVFAHLPLLVNEQRKKLSKRRDDVSVGDYRERGYLPEAMANYLALLGWGPPDEVEIRPMQRDRRAVPPGGREPGGGVLRPEEARSTSMRSICGPCHPTSSCSGPNRG